MHITATIDVSTPTGRKLVRELEKHTRVVKISYPENSIVPEDAISLEQGVEELWNHLENRVGFDLRKYEEI